MQVQLQQNKRKSEALRDLLATTEAAASEAEAAGLLDQAASKVTGNSSSSSRARQSCSKASAALQNLLDELLDSNGD